MDNNIPTNNTNNNEPIQMQSQPSTQHLLSHLCSQIQASCQFLTYFKRNIRQDDLKRFDTQKTFKQYIKSNLPLYQSSTNYPKINQQSLIQLFIQTAYFIFSCRRVNMKPQLSGDNIFVLQSQSQGGGYVVQKKFTLIMAYQFEKDSIFNDSKQSIQLITQVYDILFQQFKNYHNLIKNRLNVFDQELEKIVLNFEKQFTYLKMNSEKAFQQTGKQKQFFLCLEETSLFKEYSTLLKIKNASILDLIKINQNNFEEFKECKKKEKQLMAKIQISQKSQSNKQHNQDFESVKKIERDLQDNYASFFRYLTVKDSNMMIQQPSVVNQQQQQMHHSLEKMKINFKLKERNNQTNDFYQAVKAIIPEMTGQQFAMKVQSNNNFQQADPDMQYTIQYSNDRNSICVRLFTNKIVPHLQNTDFLMFQSNILAFDAINVNIEIVQMIEQTVQGKKSVKKLAFKGTSCLYNKQHPLDKFLLLMDCTMIAAKVCQPELTFNKAVYYSSNPDHERLNIVSKKISHYSKIFLKCAEKVYSQG